MGRTIIFGLLGALLAMRLDFGALATLLGLGFGLALSEYLRIAHALKQLNSRLEGLESLENLQKIQQQAPGENVAHTKSSIRPPAAARANATFQTESEPTVSLPPTSAPSAAEIGTPPGEHTAAPVRARSSAPQKRKPRPLQGLLDRLSTTTRIGIVVLFFGVSFLLKYAADRGMFPIELRLLCVVVLGLVIYQLGRKLQAKERVYGLLLRGAAIGIWYLSCYAAYSLYHFIGVNLSFAILVALSGFTAWNAVRHDARAMAIFGAVGGFMAPILLSSGDGNHILLFTYYAVINAGIVAIAYRQTWRELPLVGFIFTFGIGAFWGATSYEPEFFASTEPFLLLSAIFYLAVPLLFANQAEHGKSPLYGNAIVFGTPAIAFALQLRLVSNFEHGDTWSALAFGSAYALVLAFMWRKLAASALLLRDAMLGIAVVFFTLAIAFAFEQQMAGALWALEAAGGVWFASRQKRVWGCYLALLILVGSGVLWLWDAPTAGSRLMLNPAFVQIVVISFSGLFIAFILDTHRDLMHNIFVKLAAAWAAVWWLGGGVWQISFHLPDAMALHVLGLYLICTSAALLCLYHFTSRNLAGYMTGFSMLILGALGLVAAVQTAGPLDGWGVYVWPLAIIFLYAANYALSSAHYLLFVVRANYLLAAALLVAIGVFEFYPFFTARYPGHAGQLLGLTLAPLCMFWLLRLVHVWRAEFDALHAKTIAGALTGLLGICFWVGLFIAPAIVTHTGTPIVWPLNLTQLALLLSIAMWWQQHGSESNSGIPRNQGWLVLGICAFALANAMLLRLIYLQQDIPYDAAALFRNDAVQTTFSVFWSLVGVTAVMWSSRHQHSTLWHIGMGLLAVVVAKLFLVDLAQSGTVERIVSFMVVGLLLMTVGWKSPRPQRGQVATVTDT